MSPSGIRKVVSQRCTYLVERVREREQKGLPTSWLTDELEVWRRVADKVPEWRLHVPRRVS